MGNIVTFYQEKDRFGENRDTLNQLNQLLEIKGKEKADLEKLERAIDFFNSIGIEVDISIRFQTEAFY